MIKQTIYTITTNRQEQIRSIMTDFLKRFSSTGDCIQALVKFHNLNRELGLIRCSCGNMDIPDCVRSRSINCPKCRKIWWLTAATPFGRARDLRPYLAAMQLMKHGVKVKPRELAEIFDIAVSTAFVIFKKLQMAICTHMENDFLIVRSKALSSAYGKRSVATEKFMHPISEEDAFDEQEEALTQECREETSALPILQDLTPDARAIWDALGQQDVHFDALAQLTNLSVPTINAQLTLLELDRLIDYLPGNLIRRTMQRVESAPSKEPHKKIVASLSSFVRNYHHRVSRKYIQLYAAAYWCIKDRERWGNNDALLSAFLSAGSISWRQIRDYVSPAFIKLLPTSYDR